MYKRQVAGIRTPNPINKWGRTDKNKELETLDEAMPSIYDELEGIRSKLELHYKDMQDIEFTIENNRLWMLQTRSGKRNGVAAVKVATDMLSENLITKEIAINRVKPSQLDELLHPMVDPIAEQKGVKLAEGLPAGPGGATGQIVFTSEDAEVWAKEGKKVILVRNETSPEDVHGMHAAEAILTARGGMTSHAALVARGWGKACIVGCSNLNIDLKQLEKKITKKTKAVMLVHALANCTDISLLKKILKKYKSWIDNQKPHFYK